MAEDKKLRWVAGTLISAIVVLGLLVTVIVYSGAYDVSVKSGHSRLVSGTLNTLMIRSVRAHAREVRPPANLKLDDRAFAQRAVGGYEAMCRMCHGAPGKKPDPWELYPPAPDLVEALREKRWSDSEVFWIIKHGIKDTAMSGFGGSHSDEELWALTALVRQMSGITPEDYRGMTERAATEQKPHSPAERPPTGNDGPQSKTDPPETHKH
jgi:cytochrome c553